MVERGVGGVSSKLKSCLSLKLLVFFTPCKVVIYLYIVHIWNCQCNAPSLYLITTREPCVETKHRFHGQEISHSLDLKKYDGIICVSGDGVLVEVSKCSKSCMLLQLCKN
jgi:hypothetical protein